MRTIEVDLGRPLRDIDCLEARRVLVIGFEASTLLFADRDPIGQEVLLNGIPYRVAGRVRKKLQDSNYTGQDDERLFIPYEAARRDFPLPGQNDTSDSLSAIIANSRPAVVQDLRRRFEGGEDLMTYLLGGGGPVEQQIRDVLGPRKGFDPADTEAISFWNTAMEAVMFEKMIGAMHEFFLAVSLITLALGGIGVMNIMLVSVRERTHEIGLRKALGATERDIFVQFLAESAAVCVVAGVLGLAFGAAAVKILAWSIGPNSGFMSRPVLEPAGAVAVTVVLVVVGIAAGLLPALRAARVEPAESLRSA